MFEIVDYIEGASCVLCDKGASLVVQCKAGTLNGPLCQKCLTRQVKARKGVPKNGEATLPCASPVS